MFTQAPIDQDFAALMQASPSFNALTKEDREKITLRIVTLPLPEQLEYKDFFMQEQEVMREAQAEELHAHYLKLKEVYDRLKGVQKTREEKAKKAEMQVELQKEEEMLKNIESDIDSLS